MARNKTNKKSNPLTFKKKFFRVIKLFVLSVFIVVLIKTFLFDTVVVPDHSMETMMNKGDLVVVNKIIYGSQPAKNIPLINIEIPAIKFPSVRQPLRGDILCFEEANSLTQNYFSICRCIGLPGDTVEIKNKQLFVNGKEFFYGPEVNSKPGFIMLSGIPDSRVKPAGYNWNSDNYGPIIIPAKNELISLDQKNIYLLQHVMEKENPFSDIQITSGKLFAEEREIKTYRVEENYYFLLGDNINNSIDSRFIGLIAESSIIGKAEFVLFPFPGDLF